MSGDRELDDVFTRKVVPSGTSYVTFAAVTSWDGVPRAGSSRLSFPSKRHTYQRGNGHLTCGVTFE